jgi:hypothetical protein
MSRIPVVRTSPAASHGRVQSRPTDFARFTMRNAAAVPRGAKMSGDVGRTFVHLWVAKDEVRFTLNDDGTTYKATRQQLIALRKALRADGGQGERGRAGKAVFLAHVDRIVMQRVGTALPG